MYYINIQRYVTLMCCKIKTTSNVCKTNMCTMQTVCATSSVLASVSCVVISLFFIDVEATIFIVHITNKWGSFDLVVNLSGVALLNRLFEIYADTITWRFRGIKKLQTNLTLSQLTESTTLHISLSGGGSCFSLESWCMVR